MLGIKTKGNVISLEAGEDFVKPFTCVGIGDADGNVKYQDASTSVATAVIGVIQNSASDGEMVAVQLDGIALIEVQAAVSRGSRVHVASIDGRIDDSQDGTVGAVYIGIALEAATAKGQIISVLINCPAVAEDGGS